MPSIPVILTLLVILVTLIAFIREWAAPDVIALTILCLVVALGLVDAKKMTDVFKNEAPITIAALFVIGGALERSGAVDHMGRLLRDRLSGSIRGAVLSFSLLAAFFSAWMNNTAIVAIMLPVTLGFARSKNISASKLLMPLSYCSILGGCCTLIGTSTNILVNGALRDLGENTMSMFELSPVGVPLAIVGVIYLTIFVPKLVPDRASITGSLDIDLRSTPLYHLLIQSGSTLIGQKLIDTTLGNRDAGIHVIEIRRNGARLMQPVQKIIVQKNDRFLIAMHSRKGTTGKPDEVFAGMGAEVLSQIEGLVTELVVRDESSLLGVTLAASDFRQNYNSVVLAVHRNGINITDKIAELALETGDTLLVITPRHNLGALEATRDFVLTDDTHDEASKPVGESAPPKPKSHVVLSWAALFGVVLVATLSDFLHPVFSWVPDIPIHYCALVGALALLWLKILTPREAYASIDWQVLLMLYGLLGLGMAMQNTGTAQWLAETMVGVARNVVPSAHLPMALLWIIFLLTLLLTEVLSNNATAVMMVPIVVKMAHGLNVNPWPFIIAVTIAASTAFALPMGYQTHMMVYGPGGYKFRDFLRVGIPLNIICWVVSCLLIPLFWPF